jgi:glycerophosphoryl diester phosphodiesterase
MKKYLITTSIKVLFVNILALLFFAIFYLLIIFITIMVIKSNVIVRLQYAISMTVIDSVNRMLIFFYSLAMIIINLEASVFLCKKLSTKKPRIYSETPIILKENQNKKKRGRIWSLIVIIALIFFIFTNDDFLFSFRLRTGYNPEGKKPNIIAHRGNSNAAPENTLSALSSAIDVKADGAEIDVRMTKDGEIVLMHDSKLLRTAGVNSNVNQLNYSELSDIDVGSWFSPEFKGERIPTLMEALELCKDKLNLMIEIKSDKNKEHEIAKRVLENVEAMGMEDDVIIASFNPKVLDEVKKLNKKIPTCLILRFAYGNIEEMEYVDIFSVESRFMHIKLLQSIQNNGKSLVVWNVSESYQVESLNHLDIDAIIIGDPIRAREIIYEDAAPGFMNKIIASILN